MPYFHEEIARLRRELAALEQHLVLVSPSGSDLEPPLFVNIAMPPCNDADLERLLAQDAG